MFPTGIPQTSHKIFPNHKIQLRIWEKAILHIIFLGLDFFEFILGFSQLFEVIIMCQVLSRRLFLSVLEVVQPGQVSFQTGSTFCELWF